VPRQLGRIEANRKGIRAGIVVSCNHSSFALAFDLRLT